MARGAYLRSPVSPSSILPLSSPPGTRGILVTDFDGTITTGDFFELVRRRWPQVPDPWDQALAGTIPMREALRRIFAGVRGTQNELLALCEQSSVGHEFGIAFRQLQQAGWRIIVASAGCDFYIHHTLSRVGVQAEVVAHRGDFIPGQGLVMQPMDDSPFAHPRFGLNKAEVVRHVQTTGLPVAFAGDGTPDLDPLLLVPARYRFATGWAAEELIRRGADFQRFSRWPELAHLLLRYA